MSLQIPQHYPVQYANNVEMLVQQTGGRLRNAVSTGQYDGAESARAINQVGTTRPNKNLARLSGTPVNDIPADSRWIYPNEYDHASYITKQDEVRLMIDLKGPYIQAAAEAMGRAEDEEVLMGFYSDAKTGKTGGTTTSFSAGQIVAVTTGGGGSSVGLNVPKLRAAKRILKQGGVDLRQDEIYMAITAKDEDDLLNEVQIVSNEYSNLKPKFDENGNLMRFMGINFIQIEFTDTTSYPDAGAVGGTGSLVNGSSQRLCPVWVKSGMHLGYWNRLQTKVDERPDLRYATQLYSRQVLGATRTQEKKIVQVICA